MTMPIRRRWRSAPSAHSIQEVTKAALSGRFSRDGVVSEIDGSRARIGSVTGLDVAPDGALLILDRITPLDAQGAVIWRYADGNLETVVEIPNDEAVGLLLPEDIMVDSAGLIYISDRKTGRVWRIAMAGEDLSVFLAVALRRNLRGDGLGF